MLKPSSSQLAGDRPISFILERDGQRVQDAYVPLVIRPEDLTRTEPSRLVVQQTLGGAWVDNFGPGIQQIQISGHTGWRGESRQGGKDGIELFTHLNKWVFQQWHRLREAEIKAGRDPSVINLIFSDALDEFACEVAPMSFVLRRSKSRPLLMQYQISLLTLEMRDPPPKPLPKADPDMGLDSMDTLVGRLNRLAKDIKKWFADGPLVSALKKFVNMTKSMLAMVSGLVRAAKGVVDATIGGVLGVVGMIATAGRNIAQALTAVPNLAQYTKARLMELGSAYNAAVCLISNAFKVRKFYPDFSSVYGASTCSSTAGGRGPSPFADLNTFDEIGRSSRGQFPMTVNGWASAAIARQSQADPVLSPRTVEQMKADLVAMADGVSFK